MYMYLSLYVHLLVTLRYIKVTTFSASFIVQVTTYVSFCLYNTVIQVKFLKDIAESQDLTDVLQKLSSIAVHVMDTGCMRWVCLIVTMTTTY